MRIEKGWAGMALVAMVGLLALGCSDNGNGDGDGDEGTGPRQDASTTTMDLSGAADTPFCNGFVEALGDFQDGMNNEAAGGGQDRASTLLDEFKSSFEAAAANAPEDARADLDAANDIVQQVDSWVDLLRLSDNQLAVIGRVNEYVSTTCNIDLETSPQPIGA